MHRHTCLIHICQRYSDLKAACLDIYLSKISKITIMTQKLSSKVNLDFSRKKRHFYVRKFVYVGWDQKPCAVAILYMRKMKKIKA